MYVGVLHRLQRGKTARRAADELGAADRSPLHRGRRRNSATGAGDWTLPVLE